MQDNYDIVPDKLNEKPTQFKGLTTYEITSTIVKFNIFFMILAMIAGAIYGIVATFLLMGVSIGVGTGLGFWYCVSVVAKKKAGTPYGYYGRKQYLNSYLVKFGILRVRTIQRSGLWRHFK